MENELIFDQLSKRALTRRILSYEAVGFTLASLLFWANEVFDLPHEVFGAPPTPINWYENIIETVAVAVLAAFVLMSTIRLLRRMKYLEGFLRVCAFCKKVHDGQEWIAMEVFLQTKSAAVLSHGFCPECGQKNYGEYVKRR